MKKKSVVSLIKYYSEKNDLGFRNEAYEIAKEFDKAGDFQLAEYIMSMLSSANTFVPQIQESISSYFEKIDAEGDMLLLPDRIMQDLMGIVNAVGHKLGVNKFLFAGAPGTGKTEAVKQLGRILDRDVYSVAFSSVIDSKLGQTQKNISNLFKEINSFRNPNKVLILFDEVDALALDRTDKNDHREMGRATTELLKGLDKVDERILLVATTNLYEHFDKAVVRRFDSVIDFNRYSEEDLINVAEGLLDKYLSHFKLANRDIRLFKKIIRLMDPIVYPGDLKNIIKTSVAFSDPNDGSDYFRRLYSSICGERPESLLKLQQQNFTVREIEILTKKSKSSVARELKGEDSE